MPKTRNGRCPTPLRRPTATWIAAILLVASACAVPAATEEEPAPTKEASQWPDSAAGQLGRGWVEAFNQGEPAMRKFLVENVAAASLAARDVDSRLATYRDLRGRMGRLRFVTVVTAEPLRVTVALADGEGQRHEFEFVATEEPPQTLASVTGRVTQRHGGMFPH
jgi:hypothetical protein